MKRPSKPNPLHIILISLLIATAQTVINTEKPNPSPLPQPPDIARAQPPRYTSFCDGDKACEEREIDFIRLNGRTPTTDSEIIHVYDLKSEEDLFTGKYNTPVSKPLPNDVYCDDCDETHIVQ